MADITEKEQFERIVAAKLGKGFVGIDPSDVRSVFDRIGDDFTFFRSAFESAEELKSALTSLLLHHSGEPRSACFAIEVSPAVTLEYIDSIAKVISEFFFGTIVWSVCFDEKLKGKRFNVHLYFGV